MTKKALKDDIRSLMKSVAIVAEPWADSAYYGDAEKWTSLFWNEGGHFKRFFNRLDLDYVLELAVGYGRHAERAASLCRHLILMDIIGRNLKVCKVRLDGCRNVSYLQNNGYDYQPVTDDILSAIYCYDAAVHFSPDIVEAYLLDSFRVLRPGGRALLHHSNYEAPQERHFGQNPHARNHMTFSLFISLAEKAGLVVEESISMSWGEQPDLDRLTLLAKPK